MKAIAEHAAMWQEATIPVERLEIWNIFCAQLVACSGKQASSVFCVSTFHKCLDYKTLRGKIVFSWILSNTWVKEALMLLRKILVRVEETKDFNK